MGTVEEKFKLFDFSQERVRVLHYTWIAFFLTFYVWFNFAPLKSSMIEAFDFLTEENFKSLLLCNVALTIPARILIGSMVDKYGPRVTYAGLMVITVIPGLLFAFGGTLVQLIVSRLLLSSIGAGFVIGIKMTANWFPAKQIGRAEGFYAGWGNFGSAAAAGLVPVIGLSLIGGEIGWKWSLALSSIVTALYGVFYYFKVKDYPTGKEPKQSSGAKRASALPVSNYKGLVAYFFWTLPLYLALGVLAMNLQKQVVVGDDFKVDQYNGSKEVVISKSDRLDFLQSGGINNYYNGNDELRIYNGSSFEKVPIADSIKKSEISRSDIQNATKVEVYRKNKLKQTIEGEAILKTFDKLTPLKQLSKPDLAAGTHIQSMNDFSGGEVIVRPMNFLFSKTIMYIIWGVLVVLYLYQCFNIYRYNAPRLKKGIPEVEKYHFGSVGALNTTYFANFGAELAVVSMLPMFFEGVFNLTPQLAGFVAMSFAFVNLFARPLGGYLSDKMGSRKKTMLMYMVGITIGFALMGLITKYAGIGADGKTLLAPMFDGSWWLVLSVIITMFCSLFVQGAEGATFAMIPSIKKELTGRIAGMAGAYGNVGAVFYLFILTLVDYKQFFFILAIGAFVSVLACGFMLKEPEGSFDDEDDAH